MDRWFIIACLGVVGVLVVALLLHTGTKTRVDDLVRRQSDEVEVLRASLEETNTRSEKIIERLAEIEARVEGLQSDLAKLGVRPRKDIPRKGTPIRDFFERHRKKDKE
jgi:hypothetical protein